MVQWGTTDKENKCHKWLQTSSPVLFFLFSLTCHRSHWSLPPLPLSGTCAQLAYSSFSPHSKALYHSPVYLEEPISPAPFNAIFFNFVLLCLFPDPFHCRNSFSLLSLSSSTQTSAYLETAYLTPKPAKALETAASLWGGLKRDVAGERCLPSGVHSSPFQTNPFAALAVASRGVISHLIAPNGFLFLGFIQLLFKLNKISHNKIFQEEILQLNQELWKSFPLLTFNLHLCDLFDAVQLLLEKTGNFSLAYFRPLSYPSSLIFYQSWKVLICVFYIVSFGNSTGHCSQRVQICPYFE